MILVCHIFESLLRTLRLLCDQAVFMFFCFVLQQAHHLVTLGSIVERNAQNLSGTVPGIGYTVWWICWHIVSLFWRGPGLFSLHCWRAQMGFRLPVVRCWLGHIWYFPQYRCCCYRHSCKGSTNTVPTRGCCAAERKSWKRLHCRLMILTRYPVGGSGNLSNMEFQRAFLSLVHHWVRGCLSWEYSKRALFRW